MESICVSKDKKLHGLAWREKSIVEEKYNSLEERVNVFSKKISFMVMHGEQKELSMTIACIFSQGENMYSMLVYMTIEGGG